MFTLAAFVLIVAVAWYAGRLNVRALSNVVVLSDEGFRNPIEARSVLTLMYNASHAVSASPDRIYHRDIEIER
jgi:hypothetical protein